MSLQSTPQFSTLPLSKAVLQVVKELGYERLTPIQAKSIPLLLQGKDVIGQSKTGSGKTAAFCIPILEKIELEGANRRLQAIILCPTRELCTQVAREARKLGRHLPGLQVVILSGGQPMAAQVAALEKGVHIAVGTPGRVIDHLNRKTLDLSRVFTVVLDEADRMLDMGFQEDMEKILGRMPKSRQTVLFSATYPKTIESISRLYQKNPTRVTVETAPEDAPRIRQLFYEVEPEDKAKALVWMLSQNISESAIVFCNLKATVVDLDRYLSGLKISVGAIHGDLEQFERDRVLAKFRNGSTRILIATDVAARGLDIEDLDVVYNFDLPNPDVYVHRIGRTGRAGKKGLAILMVTARQRPKLAELEKETGIAITERKLTELRHLDALELAPKTEQVAKMETLRIAGGRKDKVRPGDILGALTGEAGGFKGADVGKIEIHDTFSYVAVSKHIAENAVKRLTEGKIKGRRFRVNLVR